MMKTGNSVPITRSRTEACRESKENIPLGPPEKKRKLFGRDDYPKQTPTLKYNGREALSVLSTKQPVEESVQAVSVNGPDECEETLMTTSEVEALIKMKMVGKAKTDAKGRMDQMMDYIKKLRACAQQFLQKEAGYILEKGQLMDQIEEQRRKREDIVFAMKIEKGKLEDDLTQLKLRCSTLEADLGTTNAEKKELLMVHDKESEALHIAEEEKSKLSNQIDKLKDELSTSSDQIKSLHDINKRLTEYNTSLQVYNNKLQTDAATAT